MTQEHIPTTHTMARYSIERESDCVEDKQVHGGKKTIRVSRYRFSDQPKPAIFYTYCIPPGASEGVHVHPPEGNIDEYYFIMSGTGQMEIDKAFVQVKAGDHIHTPMGTCHGIENTHPTESLRVFLTAVARPKKP